MKIIGLNVQLNAIYQLIYISSFCFSAFEFKTSLFLQVFDMASRQKK